MNKYEIGVAKWCLTLMLAICILGAWAKAGFPQIDIGPNATKAIENLIPIIGIVCGATLLIAIFFFFAKDRSGERRAMQQMYEAQRDCARADEAEYNLDAQRLQLALAQEMIALEKMRLQEVQQAQQSCDASAYGFSIPCDAGASTSALARKATTSARLTMSSAYSPSPA